MSLASWFSWGSSTNSDTLPDLFPLAVLEKDFINIDTVNIYAKILTDVLERTQGIPEENLPALWDNCVKSEASDGLVTLLAKAMSEKKELYLVWVPALKLLRKANNTEEQQIRQDYASRGESAAGTYISFKQYNRTDMVRIYAALEYCTVAGLNKQMNVSKAVQFKISDMRASVALSDKSEADKQLVTMAKGLAAGKDVGMDAKDMIDVLKPDLAAVTSSMELNNEKRAFYLGMPASYITGKAPKGLGDSGEGDQKAVERGLKNYYFSIIKPVTEAVFGIKTTFKSEDYMQLSTALEAMKTFEITSEELMTIENKISLINKLFGFPAETKGGPEAKPEPPPEPDSTKTGPEPKPPAAGQR